MEKLYQKYKNLPLQFDLFEGREIIFLDFETTGLDPQSSEIIEIGAVLAKNFEITKEFQSLVRPEKKIPLRISKKTGITNEMVKKAPKITDILPQLLKFIGNREIIAYNAQFEKDFLERASREVLGEVVPFKYIDALELTRLVLPSLSSHKQEKVAEELDLPFPESHRALEDARTLFLIYLFLIKVTANLNPQVTRAISEFSTETIWPMREIFKLVYHLSPNQKETTFNLENVLEKDKDLHKEESQIRETRDVDLKNIVLDEISESFSKNGLLSKQFTDYEERAEQLEMALFCAESLNNKQHLIVEAGPGTGKSLAYLVPAIYFATLNNIRVVVSTKTINLQEQLYHKDLPFLKKAIKQRFNYAILKGRQNYLCLRKLNSLLRENPPMPAEKISVLSMMLIFLTQNTTGDFSNLNLANDYGLFSEICSDSTGCLRERCPWRRKKLCYYYKARDKAKNSHLMVINHSLLFTDLASQENFLPQTDFIIIDEAHSIEDEATKQLSIEFSYYGLESFTNALYASYRRERSGFLPRLMRIAGRLTPELGIPVSQIAEKTISQMVILKNHTELFFRSLKNFGQSFLREEDYLSQKIRLTPSNREKQEFEEVKIFAADFSHSLASLQNSLKDLDSEVKKWQDQNFDFYDELMLDLAEHQSKVEAFKSSLDFIIDGASDDYVFWAEIFTRLGDHRDCLFASPLEIGPALAEKLFSRKESVIMASATLAVGQSFEYFMKSVGLDLVEEKIVRHYRLASSFDFEKQMVIYLASDTPDPKDEEKYRKKIEEFIPPLHKILDGGILTLFTSYKLMHAIYKSTVPILERDDFLVLCQGIDGPRRQITDEFVRDFKASLFGTASFWEGVDAPGETLKCVVITRLPFSSPQEPINEARIEFLASQGIDPFKEFSLPQAVLRLRQGMGRLIRTKKDRGLVIILDSRIIYQRYGDRFTQSFPSTNCLTLSTEEILSELAKSG